MYKFLLAWRYLRTRWIALASIISVTLGVATLIIVNSVMEGFTQEMHERLHGILSDVVVESVGLGGIPDPAWHERIIREELGDDLVGVTAAVRVPAMLNCQVRGQWLTQQIMLIGIDERTYGNVSDFSKYLKHPENRKELSFLLRDGGFDEPLPSSGWEHRRLRVSTERAYQEEWDRAEAARRAASGEVGGGEVGGRPGFVGGISEPGLAASDLPNGGVTASEPGVETAPAGDLASNEPATADQVPASDVANDETTPAMPAVVDPFRRQGAPAPAASDSPENVFDEMREQHTGIVLGIAITSVRHRNQNGKVQDYFLARPGDDVQITFPNSGQPPKAVSDKFTIVDLYESKMSEYDSSFAFVPLSRLQDLRGMIDPVSGTPAVTSIQLRLRKGADLNAARDRLRKRFPIEQYQYRVETWRDLQGPLLAAVQMETTLLNILLFLIIAVAGFGILATFFMIVVEKTRDIGILKSLGAPSGGVMSIFLHYGLSLGVVGSGVGVVLGLLFVANINQIAAALEWISGREVFDPTIYYFQQIPTIVKPFTVVWVTIGSVLIAVLASVLPALRAARLHPVRALRYE
ncbi:MAG: FtsX-like permease family protein [Pirellulales bacterium]